MQKQRARNQGDKLARRESIVAEALSMWDEVAYPDFTMNALAARLGLVKGTLYLYFPTKEELFLTLYERLLGEWFEALESGLGKGGVWSPERLARTFTQTLVERPALTRLVPLLEGILEHNISSEKARMYKQWLLGKVASVGGRIEKLLPYLKPGDGASALVYVQALVSGLQQMSDPAPVVAQVLQDPGLGVLKVEFGATLERGIAALLRGLKENL